jgi:hypothetical protein
MEDVATLVQHVLILVLVVGWHIRNNIISIAGYIDYVYNLNKYYY